MRNVTHEAVGAAATLAVCAATSSGTLVGVGAAAASLLGSRLPDVDQLGTRIHRRTRLERLSLLARLVFGVVRVPMTLFAVLARHRGATHWLLSGAATTILFASAAATVWPPITRSVAIGIGCGFCAHLLVDACTPHGAPLLGPISTRRVHLLPPGHRIATGGRGDLLMLLTATFTVAALGLMILQSA